MNTVNHKMIELARMSRGYTQKDLVSLLPKINQPNLSKIEKGILGVTDETLATIAKALNYPIDFFYLEELKTPLSSIYFRKRLTLSQKVVDKIFTDVKIILKSIDTLLADVELKEYAKYSFDITNGWTPTDAAIRMRELFIIPSGAIKNLVTKIEEEGIIVYFYDSSEDKFDGLTAYSDKGYPIIFVNKNMSNDRIRFTITHELAHLVLHIPCNVEPWRDVEEEANIFASEFLMPKKECFSELVGLTYNKLTLLKAFWGVSKAAIIRRAKTVGAISESTYSYLMIELGRRNERKNETGFVELDNPKILSEVKNLLKNELDYTDEILANAMSLQLEDYEKYFENRNLVKLKMIAFKHAI